MQDHQALQTSFERDGFVHVQQFLSPAEMDQLEANLARFIRDLVPTLPKAEAMFEDYSKPESLKQISVLAVDPFFAQMLASPKIVSLAESLLQDKVVPQNIEYFGKPPRSGRPTPPHQDGYYFCLAPNEALTVWIALDDVDEENGALHYVKRSHMLGVLPHGPSHILGFSQGLVGGGSNESGEEVTCRAKRGDCLIHHSLMIHSAGANTSPRQRRAIGVVYYAQRAKVDEQAHRRYQEMLLSNRQEKGVV
jgi:phytanoyl-CoA hydroxylase